MRVCISIDFWIQTNNWRTPMKYISVWSNRYSVSSKLLIVYLAAVLLSGCGDAAPNSSSANKPANIAFNASNANSTNSMANTNQTSGDKTMVRDPIEAGRFKCAKDEVITLDFQAINTTSTINYRFKNIRIKNIH